MKKRNSNLFTEKDAPQKSSSDNNQETAWWQPAMTIFSQVTGLIAGPILIALFVGKALDKKYNTDPWIFLGLTAVAFFISSMGIVKIAANYSKKIEKELDAKKKDSDSAKNNFKKKNK